MEILDKSEASFPVRLMFLIRAGKVKGKGRTSLLPPGISIEGYSGIDSGAKIREETNGH